MSNKHTPGPWSYWPNCTRDGGMVTQDATMSHIAAPVVYATPGRTEANARLIAAAPELFESLNFMVRLWESNCDMRGHNADSFAEYRSALAAIAKATGA